MIVMVIISQEDAKKTVSCPILMQIGKAIFVCQDVLEMLVQWFLPMLIDPPGDVLSLSFALKLQISILDKILQGCASQHVHYQFLLAMQKISLEHACPYVSNIQMQPILRLQGFTVIKRREGRPVS